MVNSRLKHDYFKGFGLCLERGHIWRCLYCCFGNIGFGNIGKASEICRKELRDCVK